MLAFGLLLIIIAMLLLNAAFTGKTVPELLANIGAIKPSKSPSFKPSRDS